MPRNPLAKALNDAITAAHTGQREDDVVAAKRLYRVIFRYAKKFKNRPGNKYKDTVLNMINDILKDYEDGGSL